MNIFATDMLPWRAANLCDRHVVKMVLESAQLVCTSFPAEVAPYRPTHRNHPCAVWARASLGNLRWLLAHGLALARQYTRRYGKRHASEAVLRWCSEHLELAQAPAGCRTPFAQVVPEDCRGPDTIEAYRLYYLRHKVRFAKWARGVPPPAWWVDSAMRGV